MTEIDHIEGLKLTRLKSERERLGYKLNEFAELVGTTRQTQSKYEKLERKPDSEYLEKAAELGVDVFYVLTGTRFTSIAAITRMLRMGKTIDDIVGDALPIIDDHRSKLDIHEDSCGEIQKQYISKAYENLDQKSKHGSLDPCLGDEHGSHEPAKKLDAIQLGGLGKAWLAEVLELSEEQKKAVLTLVFDHVIAKFIELNMDKDNVSSKLNEGMHNLSSYLNNNGPYSVGKNKKKP
jgi:transcriptional regulator with XRE-family HTH domain